ncbi:MAG: hypothetical protein AB1633_11955 [Elusimicrobiota bacterium]
MANFNFNFYFNSDLFGLGSGSTFGAITRNDLVTLQIPLSPLDEQKRVAKKIQELMQEV